MIWPQAKGSWQPPEARRSLEQITPQSFQKKLTLQTSSSKTPASGTEGEHISVCGTCHGSHRSHASLCPPLQLGCGHTAPLCPDWAPAPVPGCVHQCPWGCGWLGTECPVLGEAPHIWGSGAQPATLTVSALCGIWSILAAAETPSPIPESSW